ncbi:MAG: class I SAM-dependent methyltransferase, partial [Mycobacterium sp.]
MGNPVSGAELRQSMTRLLERLAVAKGEITLPAVPGMLEDYVAMCNGVFAAMGVRFDNDDVALLRKNLADQLAAAYAGSHRSTIVISYEIPVGLSANYHVGACWYTVEQSYASWVGSRREPYFGTEPDARVCALAAAAADPAAFPVLDFGAGTGRNSLALARRGHPVDAIEMTGKFAEMIRAKAAGEGLDVRVLNRDAFAAVEDLRRDYQLIVVSEVVCDFRGIDDLRAMFGLAAHCLAPGGQLVFNVFLARGGFVPDDAARQLGQQSYSMMFTYPEVAGAAAGLPLDLVAADSVYDYEKANLPAG